jgi:hypothetical protein
MLLRTRVADASSMQQRSSMQQLKLKDIECKRHLGGGAFAQVRQYSTSVNAPVV